MPEPQSTELFLILIAVFGVLVWWLIVARQVVFRILAACLAFIPAMMFGVATVNKYYDYYQNWNAAISDLTNQGVQTAVNMPNAARSGVKFGMFLGQSIDTGLAAQQGFTLRLTVSGQASHISRTVYVYLPPQYFQSAFAHYRFPAIELIHGFPGHPQDWITVLSANSTLNALVAHGVAEPTVLVMPDANGALGVSLQCLNQWHGPQDATYLAKDVPAVIGASLRVVPPGSGWGIAGYSEGGFCAANLGLQHGRTFSYAGVLSGYFKPTKNQLIHPSRRVSPFGNSTQALQNTPMDLLQSLPGQQPIAQFWIGAGGLNVGDLRAAQVFRQLLQLRQPVVRLQAAPRGGHTMFTWRILLPQMLAWMTPQLATEAAAANARSAQQHKGAATAAGPPRRGVPS